MFLAVLAVCSSQVWYEVSSSVSPTISFTGNETNGSLASVMLLVALATLIAMYTKNYLSALLHLLSLVTMGTVFTSILMQLVSVDLTAVEAAIEKATGIAGWASQKSEVVSDVYVSLWPNAALAATALLFMIFGWLVVSTLRKRSQVNVAPKKRDSKKSEPASDLWNETSNQS